MKNVSIYGKKWLDLVFENKNQQYGAYQLRQEEGKTTAKAFFSSVGIIVSVLTLFVFFTSFGDKPEELTIVTIKPVSPELFKATPEKPAAQKKQQARSNTTEKETPKLKTMVVAQTDVATTDVPVNESKSKTNTTTPANGAPDGTLPNTNDSGKLGTTDAPTAINNTVEIATSLDKQPLFPGGIERFYAYVGRTYIKPELDEPQTVRILVSFIIEKDGTMTDIKVISRTTTELNNEAIRVLKSLKTKWTAGVKDGQNVRTQYTLPITVISE